MYVERVEMFFLVNQVKPDLKLPSLIAAMGDEAYELLSNLSSPKKPSEKSYDEVIKLMADHLEPKASIMTERYRFRLRRQLVGESITQYISELKKMSKYCDFKSDLEDNLRDQLVCGLRSEAIRQRLFAEENLVYGTAVKIACAMEGAERDAAAVEEGDGRSNAVAVEEGEGGSNATAGGPAQGVMRRRKERGQRRLPAPQTSGSDTQRQRSQCDSCRQKEQQQRGEHVRGCPYVTQSQPQQQRQGHNVTAQLQLPAGPSQQPNAGNQQNQPRLWDICNVDFNFI